MDHKSNPSVLKSENVTLSRIKVHHVLMKITWADISPETLLFETWITLNTPQLVLMNLSWVAGDLVSVHFWHLKVWNLTNVTQRHTNTIVQPLAFQRHSEELTGRNRRTLVIDSHPVLFLHYVQLHHRHFIWSTRAGRMTFFPCCFPRGKLSTSNLRLAYSFNK